MLTQVVTSFFSARKHYHAFIEPLLRSWMSMRTVMASVESRQNMMPSMVLCMMQLILSIPRSGYLWDLIKHICNMCFPIIIQHAFLERNKRYARPNVRAILRTLFIICVALEVLLVLSKMMLTMSRHFESTVYYLTFISPSHPLQPVFLFMYASLFLVNPRESITMVISGPILHSLFAKVVLNKNPLTIVSDPSQWYFYRI